MSWRSTPARHSSATISRSSCCGAEGAPRGAPPPTPRAFDPRGRPPPIRKSFGQHFLRDRAILARIADALTLGPDETVIEIGAGRGDLTEALRERAARVLAIELDRALAARLRVRYADSNVTVVEGDVLDTDFGALAGGPYALVGNVPYSITTPILFHALQEPRPTRAVYLIQREVAERLAAPPGGRRYGALTVNVQAVETVELLFGVAPGSFVPAPSVASSVVRLTPRPDPVVAPVAEQAFREFVTAAFGLRRKQMRRVLRTIARVPVEEAERILADAGIDPEARPETLAPADFARVVERISRGS